jgi:hypothetical protein
MSDAVLLLMHQGKSFTEDLAEILRRQGRFLVALSSQPEKREEFEKSQPHLAAWIVTSKPQLEREDVADAAAAFGERGYRLVAAIATFEGYRLLMAELNGRLGARDSTVEALRRSLNKYQLRQFLVERGLSAVRCMQLGLEGAPDLDPGVTWFVKPVRGAASFASFVLDRSDDLKDLPKIQEQMKTDRRMSAIFMGQYDFLVEEYIDGPEFSFETIMVNEPHHVCIHEKAKVERHARTTLEAMSISPPISIDRAVVLAGATFISTCLKALGLTAGAFHIEAKYWNARRRWEIIEINPRMGGSLINASVGAITGTSVLELWVDSLLARDEAQAAVLHRRLQDISQVAALLNGTVSRATVFLSKYGEKGRTVQSIQFLPCARAPKILKLHAEPGTTLENSDRAICLMDALWQVDYAQMAAEIEALDRLATAQFRVEYQ